MTDHLKELSDAGVSIWLDDLSRERIETGNLADLDQERPRRRGHHQPVDLRRGRSPRASGTTTRCASSPTQGADVDRTVFALTTTDVRNACDVLKPVFDATNGVDGRVSIEVAPDLAHDTDATLASAKELWKEVDRENLLIKIPATTEGGPGDHRHARRGHQRQRHPDLRPRPLPVGSWTPTSPGSRRPTRRARTSPRSTRSPRSSSPASTPRSTTGSSKTGASDDLARQGRRRQRPARLPGLREVLLRRALGGARGRRRQPAAPAVGLDRREEPRLPRHDVRRRPRRREHRQHDAREDPRRRQRPRRGQGRPGAARTTTTPAQVMEALADAGIDYDDVIKTLEEEGVEKFVKSWNELLETVKTNLESAPSDRLEHGLRRRVRAVLRLPRRGGVLRRRRAAGRRRRRLADRQAGRRRCGARTPSDEAGKRLAWVGLAQESRPLVDEIVGLRDVLADRGRRPRRAVRHGRLVPRAGGHLRHPRRRADRAGLLRPRPGARARSATGSSAPSWWSPASPAARSRPTARGAPTSRRSRDADLEPAAHIVVVTDPGSPLDESATEAGYRVFHADPDVGGRYSALTAFGLVPERARRRRHRPAARRGRARSSRGSRPTTPTTRPAARRPARRGQRRGRRQDGARRPGLRHRRASATGPSS